MSRDELLVGSRHSLQANEAKYLGGMGEIKMREIKMRETD